MNILAFDTSLDACSVAAGRGLRSLSPSIYSVFEPMVSGQAERLAPMIEEAMIATGMAVRELDMIAVTTGPGTFTGTRITLAAARAMALIAHTPLVAVSSLELMAMNYRANATGADVLAVAVDARRDEVYLQCFAPHSLRPLSAPRVSAVREAPALLGRGSVVIAGSGAEAVAHAARLQGLDARAVAGDLLPDAFDILFLAMERPLFNTVQALYLRPPDAKPQIDAALART